MTKTADKRAPGCSTRPSIGGSLSGNKAIPRLADFTDENIFAELRRRGFNGELRYSKIVTV